LTENGGTPENGKKGTKSMKIHGKDWRRGKEKRREFKGGKGTGPLDN